MMMYNSYLPPPMPMSRAQYPTLPYAPFSPIGSEHMSAAPPAAASYSKEPLRPARSVVFQPTPEQKIVPPPVTKIGRLTPEERRQRIERYRQKRIKRVWKKRISYTCRKRVADQRIRIKGRFVSKNEAVAKLSNGDEKKIMGTGSAANEKSEVQEKESEKVVDENMVAAAGTSPRVKEAKRIFNITSNNS